VQSTLADKQLEHGVPLSQPILKIDPLANDCLVVEGKVTFRARH
jgi:hypothetical protein